MTDLLLLAAALAGPRGVVRTAQPPANLPDVWGARRVALVVGIDTYTDPALGDLRYAAKDAIDLADVLRDPEKGGFEAVTTLVGRVSGAEILTALDALSASLERDDTFLLYVAGHGTLDLSSDGTRLYLMPSDAWLASPDASGLALADLESRLADLPSRRRVLVLDACYSGTGRSGLSPATRERIQGLRGPVPTPAALEVSRYDARLFAAHYNQPAMEDRTLENGVYTHFLVEALSGAGTWTATAWWRWPRPTAGPGIAP